jgi:acetyl-CoA acetyltransferase
MGMGPAPASEKLLARLGLGISDFDVIELNEAFASQALAVLRRLGLPDDAAHVNPNGGAIALGHPLGASGARLVTTALYQLRRTGGLCAAELKRQADAAKIESLLLEDPLLLCTPIVRNGREATVGHCPEVWKIWQ